MGLGTAAVEGLVSATGPACRFCSAPLTQTFVDLGLSPLANSLLAEEDLPREEPRYPLHAYVCGECLLVQLGELDEEALAAHVRVQRVTWLLPAQILLGQERVRERGEAEVDERLGEWRRAEPAGRRRGGHQTFHGGCAEAHCSSSTILSRRLSMFCQ